MQIFSVFWERSLGVGEPVIFHLLLQSWKVLEGSWLCLVNCCLTPKFPFPQGAQAWQGAAQKLSVGCKITPSLNKLEPVSLGEEVLLTQTRLRKGNLVFILNFWFTLTMQSCSFLEGGQVVLLETCSLLQSRHPLWWRTKDFSNLENLPYVLGWSEIML